MISDRHLSKLLSFSNIDHFSVVEIRTAYIALNDDEKIDKSDARRFVYSELLKLVNMGWLKKLISNKKGITRYAKTNLFDVCLLKSQASVSLVIQESSTASISTTHIPETLVSRLNSYKSDLLEGLGEIEEYKDLRNQFPNLHELLLENHNEVREKNTRLLGKIKAIEKMIKSNK